MNLSITVVAALALVGCALGGPVGELNSVGPISVQDNNIGDIVNVGVNIQADIRTEIDSTIVNVLVALLTQMGDLNLVDGGASLEDHDHHGSEVAAPLNGDLLKALGNHLKAETEQQQQPKEQLEKALSEKVEQFVNQLLKKN